MILILLKAFQNLRYIDLIFLKRVQSTILCFKQTKIHTNSYKLWMQFFPYQIASQRYGTIPNAPNCDTSPKYEAYKEWGQRWWLKHLVICRYIHTVLGSGNGFGRNVETFRCKVWVFWLRYYLFLVVWRNDASHLNHSGKYVAWIWGYTVKQYFTVASVASFMGFGAKRSCHLPIAECYKSCFLMTWKPLIAAIIIDVLCLFI